MNVGDGGKIVYKLHKNQAAEREGREDRNPENPEFASIGWKIQMKTCMAEKRMI